MVALCECKLRAAFALFGFVRIAIASTNKAPFIYLTDPSKDPRKPLHNSGNVVCLISSLEMLCVWFLFRVSGFCSFCFLFLLTAS